MLIGRYDFLCAFLEPAQLPPFKGSTFRGAFGGALRRVTCVARGKECADCLLFERCLYARIFEPLPDATGQLRASAAPHPYVIEPPLTEQTVYAPGERFDFGLLLFGSANDYVPYFIYAFERMGETGIGKGLDDGRGRFQVLGVEQAGRTLYDSATGKLLGEPRLERAELGPSAAADEATVQLLTPLRAKSDNRLSRELPFQLLTRIMLRRISSLFATFGDGEPDLDYRGLTRRAEAVDIAGRDLRWRDWTRYSSRQDQSMLMGGLTGSVRYRGRLGEFLPLLELGRALHLGKQTSFGLGKIDYTAG